MVKKKILVVLSILTLSLTLISCNEGMKKTNNDSEISPQINNLESTPDVSNDKASSNNTEDIEDKLVRLYFYDSVSDNIIYYDDTIKVTDKALTNALLDALKAPSKSNVTPLIPENVNITSTKLDKDNNLFTIDFPSDFVAQMNLGSGPESNTLKALVNTIGYNYKVDNVIITLAGKPYESGHILMSEGESFKVSLSDSIEL